MAVARRDGAGWRVAAPVAVGEVGTLLARLRTEAGGDAVALGLDLPLGVPRAYAARRSEPDFPAFLRGLGAEPGFFEVCATLDQVTPARPFYPALARAGMTRLAHAAALGLAAAADLSRLCDRATNERPAGAPVFWTCGANQSGRAAISGWRDLLLPALARDEAVRLWPFDGPFLGLLAPKNVAVAEVYPAEALRQLALRLAGSKRRQSDRAALGPALLGAMAASDTRPEAALAAAALDGFGGDAAGEDRFDCVIGLLCLLGVLAGRRPDTAPDDVWIRRWEGWVLGQTAPRSRNGPIS